MVDTIGNGRKKHSKTFDKNIELRGVMSADRT
jgi:hypothetical protein